jgi:hypothetical protein
MIAPTIKGNSTTVPASNVTPRTRGGIHCVTMRVLKSEPGVVGRDAMLEDFILSDLSRVATLPVAARELEVPVGDIGESY